MRLIGTLPTEYDAHRLGDFLLSLGLPNHVEPVTEGTAWVLWIIRDDDLEQGQSRLREYQANPNDPRYTAASSAANAVRKQLAADAERRRAQHVDVRSSWAGSGFGATPVSIAIILACLVIGALTLIGPILQPGKRMADDSIASRTEETLAFQPISAVQDPDRPEYYPAGMGKGRLTTMFSSIAHGEVWRLVTPAFMHGGIIHLLFNLTWVMSLGRLIEARKGSAFLFGLVVVSAIVSNCGEAVWLAYTDGYGMFLGFSGVNYALFGYAWMKGQFQPYEGVGVNQQTVGLMLGWLVLCMVGLLGDVANAAHIMGLAIGVAVGYWPTLRRKIRTR